jgi:hypothetical protein
MSLHNYFNPYSLTQSDVGFIVRHHHIVSNTSGFAIHTTVIGTYPSFTAAQTAAVDALHTALAGYERAGIRGNVSKVINLVLRGLITGVTSDGVELPISEFEICPVHVWNETWAPRTGDEEEQALMQKIDREGNPQIKVTVPCAKPIRMSINEHVGRAKRFPEEMNPHWAQTRVPYFRRRDETPLRRVYDPPYSVDVGFVGQLSRTRERLVVQIVTLQPDELLESIEDGLQPNEESNETRSGTAGLTQDQLHEAEPRAPQSEVVCATNEPIIAMSTRQSSDNERKEKSAIRVREVESDEDNSSRGSSTPYHPRERSPQTSGRRS